MVTDGFTGNVALKTMEGAARLISRYAAGGIHAQCLPKVGRTRRRAEPPRAANPHGSQAIQWRHHGRVEGHRDQESRRRRYVRLSARHRSRGTGGAQRRTRENRRTAWTALASLRDRNVLTHRRHRQLFAGKILTNADLEKLVDTSDEWIRSRTGIERRHVAVEGETTTDLAETRRAGDGGCGSHRCGHRSDLRRHDDPDLVFPNVGTLLQSLGIHGCPAFSLEAACTGFMYALSVADKFVRLGESKCALVVGAETLTRIVDWNDRGDLRPVCGRRGRGGLEARPNRGSSAPACIRTAATRICCCTRTAYPRASNWCARARRACK